MSYLKLDLRYDIIGKNYKIVYTILKSRDFAVVVIFSQTAVFESSVQLKKIDIVRTQLPLHVLNVYSAFQMCPLTSASILVAKVWYSVEFVLFRLSSQVWFSLTSPTKTGGAKTFILCVVNCFH